MLLKLDLQGLQRLAGVIASLLEAGDAILLRGELGAGKTEFARALLRSACVDTQLEVPSPSFSIAQLYDSVRGPIAHLDLYRLSSEDDLREMGWEDMRDGIVLVEWPERLGLLMPTAGLLVQLEADDDAELRWVSLTGWNGERIQLLRGAFASG